MKDRQASCKHKPISNPTRKKRTDAEKEATGSCKEETHTKSNPKMKHKISLLAQQKNTNHVSFDVGQRKPYFPLVLLPLLRWAQPTTISQKILSFFRSKAAAFFGDFYRLGGQESGRRER